MKNNLKKNIADLIKYLKFTYNTKVIKYTKTNKILIKMSGYDVH